MKNTYINKIVAILTIFVMVGFAANALAYRGMGAGQNCPWKGNANAGFGCGFCCKANLTDDEIKKIDEARKVFFEATKDLRQSIYEKEFELSSVLAKKVLDLEKAKALQKELSTYKAQFDEKKIEHIVQMKKINPYLGKRFIECQCFRQGACNCPMNIGKFNKGRRGCPLMN